MTTLGNKKTKGVKVNEYGTKEYWEERYKDKEKLFEWFDGFKTFEKVMSQVLEKIPVRPIKFIELGCGNSAFSEGLNKYLQTSKISHKIVATDFSVNTIEYMKKRQKSDSEISSELEYLVADVTRLANTNPAPILSEEFLKGTHIVFEKGTIDSLSCAGDEDDPEDLYPRLTLENVRLLLDTSHNIDSSYPKAFVSFSYSTGRAELMSSIFKEKEGWKLERAQVERTSVKQSASAPAGNATEVYIYLKY